MMFKVSHRRVKVWFRQNHPGQRRNNTNYRMSTITRRSRR